MMHSTNFLTYLFDVTVFSALQERLTLPPLTVASEFYTHDEMEEATKFKKVTKKKRKLRKKTVVKADDLLGLEDEPSKDLGSRYPGMVF